jgi:phosphopantetheine--protein transferase-like protein
MKTANQFLSSFLPEVSQSLSGQGRFVCAYLAELPFDIFDDSRKNSLNTLARLTFNLKEKKAWYSSASEKYRVNRFSGRLVAKDAVRFYLQEYYNIKISPADITIDNDPSGKPEVSGFWPDKLSGAIKLSLAHKKGTAVALVGESKTATGIGIDIELIQPFREYFLEGAFIEKERRLVAGLGNQSEEWLVRMWCAKEAAGKALGTGIVDSPKEITVVALDVDREIIKVELSGGRLRQFQQFSGKKFRVVTFRKGKMAIAVTAL